MRSRSAIADRFLRSLAAVVLCASAVGCASLPKDVAPIPVSASIRMDDEGDWALSTSMIVEPSDTDKMPKVWRFDKEDVEIVDDRGRTILTGLFWNFPRAAKIGGRRLEVKVYPHDDSKILDVSIVFVVNDNRFYIRERFARTLEGRWRHVSF